MMDGSYVPPFRRHQAVGDSSDAPPTEGTPNNHSHQSGRNNGNRQGYRGYNRRGGRGGEQRNFFQKHQPQVDESDLYHPRDIHNYFWGGLDGAERASSSTFHDSKDGPEQLSHVLLFYLANPRWANDRIVFAKSKLALLPEYATKKAEAGEWETETALDGSRAATNGLKDSVPRDQDAAMAYNEHGSETVAQANESTSTEAQDLASLPDKKQRSLGDEPSGEKDSPSSIRLADSAKEVEQKITQDRDSLTGAQELNLFSNDGLEQSAPGDDIKYMKREDECAITKVEGVANYEAQDTPIPAPAPTSRLKYTDIRLEEAQTSLAPNQSIASEGNSKYTDIRTIPANQFYHEHERLPSAPVFPAIAPIDYVPANPLPIALFEQQRTPDLRNRSEARFAFKGWFKISRINILAPHSAELVRMLQQKWARKDRFGNVIPSKPRDASAWKTSLAMEWAVIGFQLLEGEDAPPTPQIVRVPEPEQPIAKSVNEMLSDMRLNGSAEDRQKGGHHATVKPEEDKVTPECNPGEGIPAPEK